MIRRYRRHLRMWVLENKSGFGEYFYRNLVGSRYLELKILCNSIQNFPPTIGEILSRHFYYIEKYNDVDNYPKIVKLINESHQPLKYGFATKYSLLELLEIFENELNMADILYNSIESVKFELTKLNFKSSVIDKCVIPILINYREDFIKNSVQDIIKEKVYLNILGMTGKRLRVRRVLNIKNTQLYELLDVINARRIHTGLPPEAWEDVYTLLTQSQSNPLLIKEIAMGYL